MHSTAKAPATGILCTVSGYESYESYESFVSIVTFCF